MGLGEQKKEHSLNSSQRSRVYRVNLWVSQLKSGINRRFRVLNERFRDEGGGGEKIDQDTLFVREALYANSSNVH